MNPFLVFTLGNRVWLRANETEIKSILPQEWTDFRNVDHHLLGFKLKAIDIPWRNTKELGLIMYFFQRSGLMEVRNTYEVRANPKPVFN